MDIINISEASTTGQTSFTWALPLYRLSQTFQQTN